MLCLLCWILMHWKKNQYEIKYFILQVGRKAHWPWNLIDYPQPTTNMHWNPNCPLVGKKKKKSKRKRNILQIPNSSMHMFSAITAFSVPTKGRPKPAHMYSNHCFLHCWGPLFLWPVSLCRKHNKMDSRRCHLSWPGRGGDDQGQRKGRAQGHLRRGEACLQQQPRGFRKSGEFSGRWEDQRRSITFHAFIFGSLQF